MTDVFYTKQQYTRDRYGSFLLPTSLNSFPIPRNTSLPSSGPYFNAI